MKVTLVAVISLNGKITWGSKGPQAWASKEDQDHFFELIQQSSLIVMGRQTYETSREVIKLTPGKLRIVLTTHPEKYAADSVPGQLEFKNESPAELVQRMSSSGYQEMLLVGGGKLNSAFLEAELVTDLLLTVEPVIFDTGIDVADSTIGFRKLRLQSSKKLNDMGTMLLHFKTSYRK